MNNKNLHVFEQKSPYQSPWGLKTKILIFLWELCWASLCCWTPKFLNGWRLFCLRLFGAQIHGLPFVHQRCRIERPWNIILYDHAAVGDRTALYSLGTIEIKARATVAQEAYLCTGTHDFNDPNLPLAIGRIIVGEDAFIGARAFIMPGVSIGEGALVGACSVVTKDVPAKAVCAGNPCKIIASRLKP